MATEMQNNMLLKKFGLSEDDIKASKKLFSEMPLPTPPENSRCKKQERVLGYRTLTLRREKALRLLGASEADIELENSKNLGALGISGRRRSFMVINSPKSIQIQANFNCLSNGCGCSYQHSYPPKPPLRIRRHMVSKSLKRRSKTDLHARKKPKKSDAYPCHVDYVELPSSNIELTHHTNQSKAQQLEILRLKKKVKQLESELLKNEISKS